MKKTLFSYINVLRELNYILSPKQKIYGFFAAIMTVINAFLQTLGVSIIVPLVATMTSPETVMQNNYVSRICLFFKISNSQELFLAICVSTILLYIFKNVFCVFQLWFCTKYSHMVQRELANSILKNYMNRTYDFFLNYGTSQIIRDVQKDSYGVNCVLTAIFSLLTEILTMLFIMAYVIIMDWKMAVCVAAVSIFCVFVIYKFFKDRMRIAGEQGRICAAESQKILLEAIEGIKEVQVMRKQVFFLDEFKKAYAKEQKPNITRRLVTECPTYFIEGTFVVGMMAFIAFRMFLDPDYINAMPILASFVAGAVRMLPSLGRVSSRINGLSFDIPCLNSVYNNFRENNISYKADNEEQDSGKDIVFENNICIQDLSWAYKGSDRFVLEGLNLEIPKGKSIGIIGRSGAGKSTLADIILGLHLPQKGRVEIDGSDIFSIPFEYSRVVGYVPQSIYLVDGTIRENIAFGTDLNDVDDELIWSSLKQAKLDLFVKDSEHGLETIVGERGVRFSGGQRQRLAIARALYRKPQILILDEATSALDNETENAVMDAIEDLYGSITMIIIAHRLSTVKNCDEIYEICDGKAVKRNITDIL